MKHFKIIKIDNAHNQLLCMHMYPVHATYFNMIFFKVNDKITWMKNISPLPKPLVSENLWKF